MKKILLMVVLYSGATFSCFSQISKVTIQASGLTCSMCSNAINKSLRSISYIDNVIADIRTSTFTISFKENAQVNFDKLKQKVEAAGFFVADFKAFVKFNDVQIAKDTHSKTQGMTFHFLNTKDQLLNGEYWIKVIDKGYVTIKQFKKGEMYTDMECYKTGVAGSCCKTYGLESGTRIFHVSLMPNL